MFVCTIKASHIKFFTALLLSAAVLMTIIGIIPSVEDYGYAAVVNAEYKNISSVNEQLEFLKNCGYEAESIPISVTQVKIPEQFDSAYQSYNDIQRSQGLNLLRFVGKTASAYSYALKNHDRATDVTANLLIYDGEIIACDICSTQGEGFVKALI